MLPTVLILVVILKAQGSCRSVIRDRLKAEIPSSMVRSAVASDGTISILVVNHEEESKLACSHDYLNCKYRKKTFLASLVQDTAWGYTENIIQRGYKDHTHVFLNKSMCLPSYPTYIQMHVAIWFIFEAKF